MKPTKKQNPFDVQVGQMWKAKDKRRIGKFTIIEIKIDEYLKRDESQPRGYYFTVTIDGYFAITEYSKGKTVYRSRINILNFNRYIRVK